MFLFYFSENQTSQIQRPPTDGAEAEDESRPYAVEYEEGTALISYVLYRGYFIYLYRSPIRVPVDLLLCCRRFSFRFSYFIVSFYVLFFCSIDEEDEQAESMEMAESDIKFEEFTKR